jgi:hypothetical protein
MLLVAIGKVEIVIAADPLESVAVPRTVAPLLNVTLPSALEGVTAAVSFTFSV